MVYSSSESLCPRYPYIRVYQLYNNQILGVCWSDCVLVYRQDDYACKHRRRARCTFSL